MKILVAICRITVKVCYIFIVTQLSCNTNKIYFLDRAFRCKFKVRVETD